VAYCSLIDRHQSFGRKYYFQFQCRREDGSSMFLRNVGMLSTHQTTRSHNLEDHRIDVHRLQNRRSHHSSCVRCFNPSFVSLLLFLPFSPFFISHFFIHSVILPLNFFVVVILFSLSFVCLPFFSSCSICLFVSVYRLHSYGRNEHIVLPT
jgi:hypothetical protein